MLRKYECASCRPVRSRDLVGQRLGHGLGDQRLAAPRRTVEQDALRRLRAGAPGTARRTGTGARPRRGSPRSAPRDRRCPRRRRRGSPRGRAPRPLPSAASRARRWTSGRAAADRPARIGSSSSAVPSVATSSSSPRPITITRSSPNRSLTLTTSPARSGCSTSTTLSASLRITSAPLRRRSVSTSGDRFTRILRPAVNTSTEPSSLASTIASTSGLILQHDRVSFGGNQLPGLPPAQSPPRGYRRPSPPSAGKWNESALRGATSTSAAA